MKNVYLHGSFMYDNFGDYLLFTTVFEPLSRIGDAIKCYSANVSDFYKQFINYQSLKMNKAINLADMAVFAGGGYFGEPNQHKLYWNLRMLFVHARPALKLIKRGTPICILGVGAGPLSLAISRKVVSYIFNKAEMVSVRDDESKEYLIQYGVKREINIAPDWILGCDINELIKENHIVKNERYKDCVLIHLASRNDGDNNPIQHIVEDIRYLVLQRNIKFLIITDQADNSQIERAEQLQNKLEDCSIELYKYHDPYELCSVINESKCVITDKLHVGIVATRLGKPAFSVAYHNKTVRFYRQIGREQYCIPIEDVKAGVIRRWIEEGIDEKPNCDKVLRAAKDNKRLLFQFVERHM